MSDQEKPFTPTRELAEALWETMSVVTYGGWREQQKRKVLNRLADALWAVLPEPAIRTTDSPDATVYAVRVERQEREAARLAHRIECARAVCMYCNGNCPPYHREALGPSKHGNWLHESKEASPTGTPYEVLCQATGIWALVAWDAGAVARERRDQPGEERMR